MPTSSSDWHSAFAAAADGLMNRIDRRASGTVLLQGFCLTPLARRMATWGAGLRGHLSPHPASELEALREALGGDGEWRSLPAPVDPVARSIPFEAHSLDLAVVAWQFTAAPPAPLLVVWRELLREGGEFATLLWADGSPRIPLKCLTEAIRVETGQRAKQEAMGFPAAAKTLRQAALDAGFSEARAWEESMVLSYPDPDAVFDQVWPSLGPSAVRFNPRQIASIRTRFATLLVPAVGAARPLPITHDYCGMVATR